MSIKNRKFIALEHCDFAYISKLTKKTICNDNIMFNMCIMGIAYLIIYGIWKNPSESN